ncbi:MAG TPA: molybdopterin-dependent oxidoreductase [Actinophytocola sp.]|nr:molybdopterin-dependent oxidoreductase [Actinophytocola sp.]HET9142597.1 molybdopterin-dependent oxidoreductase [Actinophytocola sp.]
MDVLERPAPAPAEPRLGVPVAILVGVLSVAAALAAGHLVAGFIGPTASPFLAVGNSAIDLTPQPVKDWAIRAFGVHDKLVLLIGMGLVLLILAALAGLLSRRRSWPGVALAAAVGGLGFLAVLGRPDLGQLGVLAPAASLLTGVLVFRWLHGLARRAESAKNGGAESTDETRRAFLLSSAGVAVGAGVLGGAGQLLSVRVDVEGSRAAIGSLVPAEPAPPVPAGADFAGNGTPRFLTANERFYRVDTALTVPRVRAQDWRLRIHGLTDREVSFSFSDIRDRRLVERPVTLTCVSNEVGGEYVSTANFVGVPIRDLLLEAGVRPGAESVLSTSADGFTANTPVDALLDQRRGALLAIGMNGEPLPVEHGFPARMVVPGLYGYVSATKWVVDWELTTFQAREGYWIPRGWAAKAPIKTQSRIDSPRPDATVPAGRLVVAGIAWAQTVGIDRVEVRLDEGAWQPAELATEVSLATWRMWRVTVDAGRGEHKVEVRATDRTGRTQTDERTAPAPDGATGWHAVEFTAA